jgi:hypothetical protein
MKGFLRVGAQMGSKNPVEGISLAGAGTKRHDPCTPGGKAGSNKKWIIFFWIAADSAFLVL